MDVEIIDEDENPMLHRTDVRFQLTHDDATPSRLSVRDSLAAKLNKGSDEVVVQKLDTKYGMRKTVGYAKVYDSADAARDVEQDYTLARNKITEDGAEEAEPEGDEEPEAEAEGDEAEAEAEEA
ncbi:30S ribosomal protein S24e [Natronomonas salina]|uniref:30S ribosomal protein S24e n=1 Tax=Natronomonas salina TaxID=1710540 RepID=UPI0015B55CD6|nr:30S ribosomal protein S24e [Natronomonas salina]QLD90600.1 30S ribosomal protein S24e [Natronomonas salina]